MGVEGVWIVFASLSGYRGDVLDDSLPLWSIDL